MLRIKKRHSVIKGVTAGAVAFAIGLTGAAAFIGDDFQADTQVYNREQPRSASSGSTTDTQKSDDKSNTDTTGSETQAASTSGSTTQPAGPSSSMTWAPAPATSTSTLGSSTTTPLPTAPVGSTSGGSSGGSTGSGGSSGGCICSDIQDAAGGIINTGVDATNPLTQPVRHTHRPSF